MFSRTRAATTTPAFLLIFMRLIEYRNTRMRHNVSTSSSHRKYTVSTSLSLLFIVGFSPVFCVEEIGDAVALTPVLNV